VGIIFHQAKNLWEARLAGVNFQRVLTLGHLELFLHPTELKALRRAYQANPPYPLALPLADYRFGEYADRFLKEFLGATMIETIDNSAYEGATIVHDMNTPVPAPLLGGFDVVIDAGSLEHIFNFPIAIKNMMRMLKLGGTVFLSTPANSLCGHGFYQFSPELLYRVFSPENGFEATRVTFLEATFTNVELSPIRRVYNVADPKSVGRRVGLTSGHPTVMMMEARKTKDLPPFAVMPQQSDYTVTWGQSKDTRPKAAKGILKGILRRLMKQLPVSWQYRLLGHYWNWQSSLANRSFYRKRS